SISTAPAVSRELKQAGLRQEHSFDSGLAHSDPVQSLWLNAGTQISCFAPTNFSWRQAAYVDSFCWAAVQEQQLSVDGVDGAPLWLHKFFPYILLLVAILMYIPALFWRFTAAPHLSSDLNFIMEELDRSYNRAIRLAKSLASSIDTKDVSDDPPR
ncbi:unnamed protein product, partial [Oncorhynchus mykiss]